jgi:hypothetical protein
MRMRRAVERGLTPRRHAPSSSRNAPAAAPAFSPPAPSWPTHRPPLPPFRVRCQAVGDRSSQQEYLRLITDALALLAPGDAAGLAAAKPAALQVRRVGAGGTGLVPRRGHGRPAGRPAGVLEPAPRHCSRPATRPHPQAVKDWIAAPDNFTCDFTDLPAVAQLASDAAAAPFLRLLAALLAGDIGAFKAAATKAVLEGVPVSEVGGEGRGGAEGRRGDG